MPTNVEPITTHSILHDLLLARFTEYKAWCEGMLEEDFDCHQIQRSYNTSLRRRFAAIAFMSSRLQNTSAFVDHLKQWIMSDWVGVETK